MGRERLKVNFKFKSNNLNINLVWAGGILNKLNLKFKSNNLKTNLVWAGGKLNI